MPRQKDPHRLHRVDMLSTECKRVKQHSLNARHHNNGAGAPFDSISKSIRKISVKMWRPTEPRACLRNGARISSRRSRSERSRKISNQTDGVSVDPIGGSSTINACVGGYSTVDGVRR